MIFRLVARGPRACSTRVRPPGTHTLPVMGGGHTVGPRAEARAPTSLRVGAEDFKSHVWHAEK